jgi:large subunit ribosomal protein L31
MKKSIHPEYKQVVFWDTTSDFKFLSRSTSVPKETIKWEDGKEYPVIKVEVSSASHPFFTGKKMFVDTAGRVEKFQKKYGKKVRFFLARFVSRSRFTRPFVFRPRPSFWYPVLYFCQSELLTAKLADQGRYSR